MLAAGMELRRGQGLWGVLLVALFMIASLAGFSMTPRAPLSGAIEGEQIDVPEVHDLSLISRKADSDEGTGGLRQLSAEPAPSPDTAEAPLALSVPLPRCARAIGPNPTRRRCSWSARGPPAIHTA